jgi:quercetin dioxygenase-like cupin family protein
VWQPAGCGHTKTPACTRTAIRAQNASALEATGVVRHKEVGDTLYVVRGPVTIYTRVPDETRIGKTGDAVQTPAGQAHRVVNESDHDVATLLIQGVGTYDFHVVLE